jgi:O-antigen ligase
VASTELVSRRRARRRSSGSFFAARFPGIAAVTRTVAGIVLGAGIAASGFPPLANAPDVLAVGLMPWRVVLTPAVLLGAGALATAWLFPRRDGVERSVCWLLVAACLLVAGAALSLLRSDDVWYSFLIGIVALLAPCAVAIGVARSTLTPALLAGAFLAATGLFLLRADLQFIKLNGLPTSAALFAAKFRNQPYDFHYYTLGNPDGTAAFLLLPLGLALFWLSHSALGARARALLAGSFGISSATMVLAYSRSALAWCIGLVFLAVARAPLARRTRMVLLGGVALLVVATLVALNTSYLLSIFSSNEGSSGSVRLGSIAEAAPVFKANPLTGFGLGMFSALDGYLPAHSAIVQAGVELGVVGLAGAILLLVSTVALFWSRARSAGQAGLPRAAAAAAASYLLYCAFAGGSSEALYNGYVSVWGLSLALLLGLAARRASG